MKGRKEERKEGREACVWVSLYDTSPCRAGEIVMVNEIRDVGR